MTPVSAEVIEAQQEISDGLWDEYFERYWDGTHADEEWWAPTMPPRAFLREGLVHMSRRWDGTQAYCGVEAVPYGVRLYSTDEAREYANMLETLSGEIDCLTCLVYQAGDWHACFT